MDKYVTGSISDKVPIKDTVGQLFHCNECFSTNVFCIGLSAFNQYFVLQGECKDCGKKVDFAVTQANRGQLDLGDSE